MRAFVLASFFLFIFSSPVFAKIRVISPSPGTWANKQSLVLDIQDGAECFYSLSGANPTESGFAYDRPILIDMAGSVRVRIVCFVPGGEAENYDISYDVLENASEDTLVRQFVAESEEHGFSELGTGVEFSLSDGLFFGAGSSVEKPRVSSKKICVERENALSRFVPVCITDGVHFWRFVLAVRAARDEPFVCASVPFSFPNWKTISFDSSVFSWRIDGEDWRDLPGRVSLNRKIAHTLEWKDSSGKIERFEILPKPRVTATRLSSGAVSFSVGEPFFLSPVLSGIDGEFSLKSSPAKKIVFDSLPGEFVSGKAMFSVWQNGVFMGLLECNWGIDREPPLAPVLSSSAESSFSRDAVLISATAEEDAKIFVKIQRAGEKEQSFKEYKNSFVLSSVGDEVARYTVTAYARDRYGNESQRTEYSVTIDELNFPVRSFSEIESVLKTKPHAHFSIEGEIRFPSGESVISSDCMISGAKNGAKIVIPSDANLLVKGTLLQIENCVVVKERSSASSKFIVCMDSNVSFTNCEISANFDRSGTAIESASSVVLLENTGLSVYSSEYACAIRASESLVNAKNCRFSVFSSTAEIFNCTGGIFSLSSSDCAVSPASNRTGRIAVFSDVSVRLSKNSFRSLCKDGVFSSPIWNDKKTYFLENIGNSTEGFGRK